MNLFRCAFLTASLAPFPAAAANAGSTSVTTPVAESSGISAFSALRAKAEQGDASAQYDLGLAYFQGRQTARDFVEAFVWLTLAAEKGVSGNALKSVTDSLPLYQMTQARHRLESLRAAYPTLRAPPPSPVVKEPEVPREAAPISPAGASLPASAPPPIVVTTPPDPAPAVEVKRLQDQLDAVESKLRESEKALSAQATELAKLRETEKTLSTQSAELAKLRESEKALAAQSAELAKLRETEKTLSMQSAELAKLRETEKTLSTQSAELEKLRETEKMLSTQTAELAKLRADTAIDQIELDLRRDQLAAARKALAAGATSDSTKDGAAALLERERTAHASTQAALADATRQLADIAAARATLQRDLASRSAVEQRKEVASDEVKKKEERITEVAGKAPALEQARAEIESTRQAPGAANNQAAAIGQPTRQITVSEEKRADPLPEPAQPKAELVAPAPTAKLPTPPTEAATLPRPPTDTAASAESKQDALHAETGRPQRKLPTTKTAAIGSVVAKSAIETLMAALRELADTDQELAALHQRINESQRKNAPHPDQKFATLQAELTGARSKLSAAIKAANRAAEAEGRRVGLDSAASSSKVSAAAAETAQSDAVDALQQITSATEELATLRARAVAVRHTDERG